jgi:3-phenylpropionate/cinnamic acid dioxygenase small subunit
MPQAYLRYEDASVDEATLGRLRRFVEHEARLLDARAFRSWIDLYADDGCYWAPASPEHDDPGRYVSLFYDEKQTMMTRVQRLMHPEIHSQIPASRLVRVLSGVWAAPTRERGADYQVESKFIMIEDRLGAARQFYGGTYTHLLSDEAGGLRIRLKRVDLTNCEHAFKTLTQPF